MNTTDPPMAIPPPMPLYTFPRSRTPDAPPMTGFAHSLPVIRHRMSKAKLRRGKPLREPLQDPRRGLLLAHWFGVRDREENELSVAKAEREAKRQQAEAAALALSTLVTAPTATLGEEGSLCVDGAAAPTAQEPAGIGVRRKEGRKEGGMSCPCLVTSREGEPERRARARDRTTRDGRAREPGSSSARLRLGRCPAGGDGVVRGGVPAEPAGRTGDASARGGGRGRRQGRQGRGRGEGAAREAAGLRHGGSGRVTHRPAGERR